MGTRLTRSIIIAALLAPALVARTNPCEDAVPAEDLSRVAAVASSAELTWVSQRRDETSPWEIVRYHADGTYEIVHQFHPTSPWFVSHLVPAGDEIFGIASRIDCPVPACGNPVGFLFRLRSGYLESLSGVTLPVQELVAGASRLHWIENRTRNDSSLMQYDLASSSTSVLLSGASITDVEIAGEWVYFAREGEVARIQSGGNEIEQIFCCATRFVVGDGGEIFFGDAIPLGTGSSISTIARFDPATGETTNFQRALGANFGIAGSWFEPIEEREGRLIGLYVSCGRYCQRTLAIATRGGWTLTGRPADALHTTSVGACRVDLYDPGPLFYAPGYRSRLLRVGLDLPVVDSADRRSIAPGDTVVLKGERLDRIDASAIEIRSSAGNGEVSVESRTAEEIVVRVWPRDRGPATLSLPAENQVSVVVPLEVYWPRRRTVTIH